MHRDRPSIGRLGRLWVRLTVRRRTLAIVVARNGPTRLTMSTSPLSRIAGPLAVAAGASVVATRLPTILFILGGGGDLTAYVLGPIHAITSVATIVAFGLLVLALVAIYEREASSAGWFGLIGFAAALLGTIFMTGNWLYEAFAVLPIAEVVPETVPTSWAAACSWVASRASFCSASAGPCPEPQPASARVSDGRLCRDGGRWPSVWRSHRSCLPHWRDDPGDRHRLARGMDDEGDQRREWCFRVGSDAPPGSLNAPAFIESQGCVSEAGL